MQDKNSSPDNEFSTAKFETFLSKTEAPAIIVLSLNKDICEKDEHTVMKSLGEQLDY